MRVRKFDEEVLLTVTDFEIDIPEQKRDDIFDQFTTFGRKGLQGENSIGIGLHISKTIVEQHQGAITVESDEGKYTTFL